MILGALLDAGLGLEKLRAELSKLGLEKWGIDAVPAVKRGLSGTRAVITFDREHHGHHHRHLSHIEEIIGSSSLDQVVKDCSISVFKRLAEAEAQVHNCDVASVHFHEVGAVDAIIDVVGAVAGIHLLGIEACYCSPIHLGSGTVTCDHGVLPVPAPATARLVQGTPVYATEVQGELLTPTGAAILTTICKGFGPMPPMVINDIGYGAGMSDPPIPNLLRIGIGTSPTEGGILEVDQLAVIETNVDDMSPQIYEHVMETAFGMGALDVFMTPVQMKKNRPGTLMTVTCRPGEVSRFAEFLMSETSSIGVRWRVENRLKAKREIRKIETPWGAIGVKYASIGDQIVNISPEYDECKKTAVEHGVTLKRVMETVKRIAVEQE
jgi:uncharacterized protein (TIGR00299 family) protein